MGLDVNEKTIADRMHAAGYRCIALGKWHLGRGPRFFPLTRGFDEFFGFQAGSRSYFPYKKRPVVAQRIFRNEEEVPEIAIRYTTDSLAKDEASCVQLGREMHGPTLCRDLAAPCGLTARYCPRLFAPKGP